MHKLLAAVVVLVVACDSPPPVKTASGERIDRLTIEERFARADEIKETTLRGERLRVAVELMEKHGVMGLRGSFESKAVVASGTVTLIVKPVEGAERRIVVNSCVHENVCPFLDAALAKGLLDRKPMACRSEAPCGK